MSGLIGELNKLCLQLIHPIIQDYIYTCVCHNVLLKEVYIHVYVSVVYPLQGKVEEWIDHTYM